MSSSTARGIHLGDAEAVTDHRVGGRAAPLAEDAEPPRLAHDVVHGEEIGFVAELGDERELVVDLVRACVPGCPRGQRSARAGLGQAAQVRGRRLAGRHQLARIFVAQLVEREIRERGDLHGLGQQLRWIEPREPLAFAQVPLAVGEQPLAGLGQRDAVANRRQRILQLRGVRARACARRRRRVSGSPCCAPSARHARRRSRSRPSRSSSTAIQARPREVRASHAPCPAASASASGGSHSASVPARARRQPQRGVAPAARNSSTSARASE